MLEVETFSALWRSAMVRRVIPGSRDALGFFTERARAPPRWPSSARGFREMALRAPNLALDAKSVSTFALVPRPENALRSPLGGPGLLGKNQWSSQAGCLSFQA
jgi:hypothetical protein